MLTALNEANYMQTGSLQFLADVATCVQGYKGSKGDMGIPGTSGDKGTVGLTGLPVTTHIIKQHLLLHTQRAFNLHGFVA